MARGRECRRRRLDGLISRRSPCVPVPMSIAGIAGSHGDLSAQRTGYKLGWKSSNESWCWVNGNIVFAHLFLKGLREQI